MSSESAKSWPTSQKSSVEREKRREREKASVICPAPSKDNIQEKMPALSLVRAEAATFSSTYRSRASLGRRTPFSPPVRQSSSQLPRQITPNRFPVCQIAANKVSSPIHHIPKPRSISPPPALLQDGSTI
jgi:hypothetical protein